MNHRQLTALVELTSLGYAVLGAATPLDDGRVTLVLQSPAGTRIVARSNGHVAPTPEELVVYVGRPGWGGRGRRKVLSEEDVRLWVDGCLTTPELMADNAMTRVTALRALRRQLGLTAYREAQEARQVALSPADIPCGRSCSGPMSRGPPCRTWPTALDGQSRTCGTVCRRT
jgi:hypothetical protein